MLDNKLNFDSKWYKNNLFELPKVNILHPSFCFCLFCFVLFCFFFCFVSFAELEWVERKEIKRTK